MTTHNHLLNATASATVVECATFSGGLSGHFIRLFCRNNRAEHPEQNVPHPHPEASNKDDMFISRRPKKK
ncbi:hypothetical protein KAU55_06460 [Candidatus Bathyarchaeota archaeon]|nr:hypothetical protein [Candidatus Bathyarchaeota archaeon]